MTLGNSIQVTLTNSVVRVINPPSVNVLLFEGFKGHQSNGTARIAPGLHSPAVAERATEPKEAGSIPGRGGRF